MGFREGSCQKIWLKRGGHLKNMVFKGGGHLKYYLIDGFHNNAKVLPECLN